MEMPEVEVTISPPEPQPETTMQAETLVQATEAKMRAEAAEAAAAEATARADALQAQLDNLVTVAGSTQATASSALEAAAAAQNVAAEVVDRLEDQENEPMMEEPETVVDDPAPAEQALPTKARNPIWKALLGR